MPSTPLDVKVINFQKLHVALERCVVFRLDAVLRPNLQNVPCVSFTGETIYLKHKTEPIRARISSAGLDLGPAVIDWEMRKG